jgi:hypothetical protein
LKQEVNDFVFFSSGFKETGQSQSNNRNQQPQAAMSGPSGMPPEPADPGTKAATNRPTCDAIMTGHECLRPPHLTPPARKKPSVALRLNLILISSSSTPCPVFQRQFVSSPPPQTSSSPCLPSPSSVSQRAPSALPASSELLNCPGPGCRLPLLSPSAARLSVPP